MDFRDGKRNWKTGKDQGGLGKMSDYTSGLGQSGYLNSVAGYQSSQKAAGKNGSPKVEDDKNLNRVGGRTVGNPKLSDKAQKYYEELKKKYSNMDFILVSPEEKEAAERNVDKFSSSKELIVLIDSDKIERMAEDEEYRKKYEGILSNASSKVKQMKQSLGANANKVSSFGMKIDDHGNASFFAVVDKSLAMQRERIAEKREENAKAQKEEAKKAAEEKLAEGMKSDSGDKVTVTAGSWDELLKKIDDVLMADRADHLLTDQERKVGQNFDFSL